MLKIIIGAAFLLAAAIAWIRSQWARSQNSGTAKQIIDDLKSGKHSIESYAESLGILITSKPLAQQPDMPAIRQRLQSLNGKRLLGKFTIQHSDMNERGKGIVIGEARATDVVPGYGRNQEMEIHFPCWLYIDLDTAQGKVDYRSTFPESKDHHYLLEDLSAAINQECMAPAVA
ncbi:MAG: hypothetical protein U0U70_01535 [Chitinophagaceae bacterium]